MGKPTNTNIKKNSQIIIDEVTRDIYEIRNRFCNTIIITCAIIALPTLLVNINRVADIGWQPIMTLNIFLLVALWGITLFRKKLSYHTKAFLILALFSILGLASLIQFGLAAAGNVLIIGISPIAILLFGKNIAKRVFFMMFYGVAIIGFLTVSGYIQTGIDMSAFATSSSSWINSIIGWAFVSAIITISIHVYNKELISNLKISRLNQKSLKHHILSQEKTIEKYHTTNQQLEHSLLQLKQYKEIIPICSYCHNICDDSGHWRTIQNYLTELSNAQYSHGICPDCIPVERKKAGL